MSFKIFTLQLFGKIKPVETIEKQRKELFDSYNEFLNVESSDELKRYLDLDKEVNSEGFKKKKTEIESLQFKGSREYDLLKEFSTLQKKSSIKNFFKVEGSADLERYQKLAKSEKLATFFSLKKYMEDGTFEKEKREILKQVFKGSPEESQLNEFRKLEKSKGIKAWIELHQSAELKKHEEFAGSEKIKKYNQLKSSSEKEKIREFKALKNDHQVRDYFRFEDSKKLKLYRETVKSAMLSKFLELKQITGSEAFKKREAFLKDKTKFEVSETAKKQKQFKQLENDQDVKFYHSFEKSGLYKNYLKVSGSAELKRFSELKETTNSKEFLDRKTYLEDKQKWEKTDEYKRQQEYLQMKKLPHLVRYFKNKGTSVFDFYKEWEVAFEDDFSGKQLDTGKWSAVPYVANKMLGDNYSLAGDLQFYTAGSNLKTNGKLSIEVRKEKSKGKIWQMPAGFVPAELDYTSGTISSWNSCWMEDGIFEAKISFNPNQHIVSSVYLSGEQNMPHVNMVESGPNSRLGVLNISNAKAVVNGMDIGNLKHGWYIFTIERKGGNYTWKINEAEVFTLSAPEVKGKLHLNASSILLSEISSSQLPSTFEIDWIKCWKKR